MDEIYSIPLISQDLHHEETIVQIADSLEHLSNVVNHIFSRINSRIEENMIRTENLTRRIDTCNSKVKNLTGASKAIQVFSSNKYPSSSIYKNYSTLFVCDESIPLLKRNDHHLRIGTKSQLHQTIEEKREFFHVKVALPASECAISATIVNKGLGSLTGDIQTVGSLLVFNTDESLYDLYNKKDQSGIRLNQDSGLISHEQPGVASLGAAPFSITNRERLIGKDAEGYLYAPDMGQVPELEMPLDLPHLPGIAGDLQYSMDAELTIAPSAITSPSLIGHSELTFNVDLLEEIDDLPDVNDEPCDVDATESLNANVIEVIAPPPPPPLPFHAIPPPPPPPPPPPMLAPSPQLSDTHSVDETLDSITESNFTSTSNQTSTAPPRSSAPPMDIHSSLMDAIRNAGGARGAKLKSSAAKETSKVVSSSGGGDLMADLHAKLSMRRKGIGGNRPEGGGSILDKMSAMIPPPTAPAGNAGNSSNEEDWD